MATAVVTMKLNNPLNAVGTDMTKESEIPQGSATVSNANYLTNGLPLTWVGTGGINASNGTSWLPMSRSTVPYDAMFYSVGGSGYTYQWDKTHGTLRIFLGGTELTNGAAIPSAVQNDLINFRAWFLKG